MNSSSPHEDLRVQRTHKLLWKSLMSLMETQEFEKISVKDICEHAMVHRTTFYKHYEDKHGLFLNGMRDMHNEFIRKVRFEEGGKDAKEDMLMNYVYIMEHVTEYQRFYKTVLCGDHVGSFYSLLRNYLIERCEQKLQRFQKAGTTFLVPPIIVAQFWAGTMISTIAWWLENDQPFPPEEMAQYMRQLLITGYQTIETKIFPVD